MKKNAQNINVIIKNKKEENKKTTSYDEKVKNLLPCLFYNYLIYTDKMNEYIKAKNEQNKNKKEEMLKEAARVDNIIYKELIGNIENDKFEEDSKYNENIKNVENYRYIIDAVNLIRNTKIELFKYQNFFTIDDEKIKKIIDIETKKINRADYIKKDPELVDYTARLVCLDYTITEKNNENINEIIAKVDDLIYQFKNIKIDKKEKEEKEKEKTRLLKKYNNIESFYKTYDLIMKKYDYLDNEKIDALLTITYENIKNKLDDPCFFMRSKTNFIDDTKNEITEELAAKNIYKNIKANYNEILGNLYDNLKNEKI